MTLRDRQHAHIVRRIDHAFKQMHVSCRYDVVVHNGDTARIVLDVTNVAPDQHTSLKDTCTQAAVSTEGIEKADVILTAERAAPASPSMSTKKPALAPRNPVPGVKKVILVGSGKGGVGKSTVTVNLAAASVRAGLKVGILDADIYGPSVHHMLCLEGQPKSPDGKAIYPIENFNIKAVSIGSMVPDGKAVVWRGAMLMKAITQIVENVIWGELDVLYVDLPPGTGDVHMTLTQKIAVDGAVVVSTPQDLALLDVRKAIDMFNLSKIPVLGLVENMSGYTCPKCHHHEDIFGTDGVDKEAARMNIPVLAKIPLNIAFRQAGDHGVPAMAQDNNVLLAELYDSILGKIHKTTIV